MTRIFLQITNHNGTIDTGRTTTKASKPFVVARAWLQTHHPEWETATVQAVKQGTEYAQCTTLYRHL